MSKPAEVVTAFLVNSNGKVLLVRRSSKIGTYSGHWSGISGYLEEDPIKQAQIELREETGLSPGDFKLENSGNPLEITDHVNKKDWIVYPFRFKLINEKQIKLNWENSEYRWIKPDEILNFKTVPNLRKTWERVKCIK